MRLQHQNVTRSFHGGDNGTVPSLRKASIRMPIGPDLFLKFDVYVVNHDILLIFRWKHHCELKFCYNELNNNFTPHPSGNSIPVTFNEETKGSRGHPFIQWIVNNMISTKEELQKLNAQFGHPSTVALVHLLKKAKPEEKHPSVRKTFKEIAKRCAPC